MAKKRILFVLAAVGLFAASSWAQCSYDTEDLTINFKRKVAGLLDGNFSVSATKKVAFSQGNLQYTKSTGKWKIMDHQYDMVETTGMTIGDDYASQDVITLFGWGTSGWNNTAADATSVHYQPYSTCNTDHNTFYYNNYQYGPSLANVAASESWSKEVAGNHPYENYDWGVFNSGDLGAGWRTLTTQEWGYLLSSRTNATSLRKWATVNSVPGLIIMPDGWSGTIADSYDLDAWTTLEGQGAVFLPAAGHRNGASVNGVGSNGFYWSSSAYSALLVYYLSFGSGNVLPQNYIQRFYGFSVRLVQDVE